MNNAQTSLIIKELCKKQNVTISKMLLDTSIRKSLIYDMEKRDFTPSAEILEKIADYLECSVDYLLGRVEQPNNNIVVNDKNSKKLLYNYENLNDTGKEKLLDYSDDLINSGNYADTVIIAEAARTSDNRKSLTTRQVTKDELEIFDTAPQSDEEL